MATTERGDADALWRAISAVTAVGGARESDASETRATEARDGTAGGMGGKMKDARARGDAGDDARRPSARASGERRRAVLSEPDAVPVVRFGAVDVGGTGCEGLDIVNDTALTQEVAFADCEAIARDGFSLDRETLTIQPGTTERVQLTWTPQRAMAATYCGQISFVVVAEAPVPMPEVEMKARIRGVAKGEVLRPLTNEAPEERVASATKRPRDARLATRRSLATSPRKLAGEDKLALDAMRAKQRRLEDEPATLALAPVARALQLQREDSASGDAHEGFYESRRVRRVPSGNMVASARARVHCVVESHHRHRRRRHDGRRLAVCEPRRERLGSRSAANCSKQTHVIVQLR